MDLKHSISGALAALLLFGTARSAFAQQDDGATHVFRPNIRSVQLYAKGSQTTVPVIQLAGGDRLDLSFDDLDADAKNYSYILELRNADWTPTSLSPMEYTKGFAGIQINSYRQSSIAITRYTHYHISLPDADYMPTKGGNYLLKVYQNGDPSNIAFQVRMLIVNNTMPVSAEVQPPYAADVHESHQKVQFSVFTGVKQFINPTQEVKVTIVQNWRWESAHYDIRPSFFRGNSLEYNTEADAVFPGTREWRWLDSRSFKFQSDRIAHLDEGTERIDAYVRTDQTRATMPYVVYQDYNGSYTITAIEGINPSFQGDYGHIHFTYAPPGGQPYDGKDMFVYGALTNYEFNDSTRMRWNADRKVYEGSLYLKQGYYDYFYVLRDAEGHVDLSQTEGNFFETENSYLILVYYRPLDGRFDELVGLGRVNSLAANNAQQTQ